MQGFLENGFPNPKYLGSRSSEKIALYNYLTDRGLEQRSILTNTWGTLGALTVRIFARERTMTSDLSLLDEMPNEKMKLILDCIKSDKYVEVLIQKTENDYIIKPKSKFNKLSIADIVELSKTADFQIIEIKMQNGNTVSITQEEFIKI